MNNYVVWLTDGDSTKKSCLCKNKKDLSTLLDHLDENEYKLIDIQVIDAIEDDYKTFCKFDGKLEHGDCKCQ